MTPADGSSTRGGSTSVRGRVRSPRISGGRLWLSCRQPASLQSRAAAPRDKQTDRQTDRQTVRQTDGSRYRLKRGWIRFGCTKQLSLLVVLGWVGLGPNFPTCGGLGWFSQPMGWVGSGHTKWTHGQLWTAYIPSLTECREWLGSRVVSVLDSGVEGPGFKSQSRRCRVTVLG